MRGVRHLALAMATLALVVLACGPNSVAPTFEAEPTLETSPTQDVEPTPDVPPTETPQPPLEETPVLLPQGATLEITNDAGTDAWYVYLSPSDADEWGEDWLDDEVIEAGETYTIVGIPEGVYDVRAEDRDEGEIEVLWEVTLEGDMTWTLTDEAALEVVNESDDTITYLYISPTDSDTWGSDWLGDDVISDGATRTFDGLSRGNYDIKAADADEDSVETVYNIPISGEMTWTVVGTTPLADNAVLRFEEDFQDNQNNWGLDVESDEVFYMSPADGEYCILAKSKHFTAWEWYEPFRTDEFIAEVSCDVQGAADAACGIGFGPDGDNLYWFEVTSYDQMFALFLLENGEWQEKLVEWTVSRDINPDTANFLSLERVQGVVSLFVNGVLVGRADSDRFPTGRVGIGGSTYEEGNGTI